MVSQHSHSAALAWRAARACALLVLALQVGCDATPPASQSAAAEDNTAMVALGEAIAEAAEAADSVEALLQPVPLMTPADEAALRRSPNAQQLARARILGTRITSESALRAALDAGTLIELEDSTETWVIRELDHSEPYVTPDARALLMRIGERFQERLVDLGLPRYRLEVSSVLRTPAAQAELRESNVNAAAGVSTHEYGTTLDIAYSGYAAPAGAPPAVEDMDDAEARALAHKAHSAFLEAAAARKSRELQKILGEVLRELQAEGDVLVTLERQQPVYHLTVARRLINGA